MLRFFCFRLRKPLGMLALFAAMLPLLAQAQSLLGSPDSAFARKPSSTDSTFSLNVVLALVLAD